MGMQSNDYGAYLRPFSKIPKFFSLPLWWIGWHPFLLSLRVTQLRKPKDCWPAMQGQCKANAKPMPFGYREAVHTICKSLTNLTTASTQAFCIQIGLSTTRPEVGNPNCWKSHIGPKKTNLKEPYKTKKQKTKYTWSCKKLKPYISFIMQATHTVCIDGKLCLFPFSNIFEKGSHRAVLKSCM